MLNSSYAKLDNTKVTCSINAVDSKGNPIYDGYLMYNTTDKYWSFPVDSNVDIGTYSYYVHCNSTEGEFGYISQGYEIMFDVASISEDLTPLTALVLIPLFLSALCIISIFALGNTGHGAFKVFMFIASFVSITVSYNYIIKIISTFYRSTSLLEFVTSDVTWYGYFMYIVIVYFILYWIKEIFNYMAGKKNAQFNFEEYNGKK